MTVWKKAFMGTIAVLMGFIGGVLIALMIDLVRANPLWVDEAANSTMLFVFLLGWGLATWLLLRRADGVLTVLQRGFLLGVAEWLVIGVIITVIKRAASVAAEAVPMGGRASWEPAARQVSMASSAMGSVSIAFAALCLVGWGAAFLAARAHRRAGERRLGTANVAPQRMPVR